MQDLFGGEAQHAIAGALQRPIPARISGAPSLMPRPIHFDDDLDRGRQKISHEAIEQRHLPAKQDAEALAANGGPKPRFGSVSAKR